MKVRDDSIARACLRYYLLYWFKRHDISSDKKLKFTKTKGIR